MSLLVVMEDDLEAGLASYLLEQLDSDIVRSRTLADARRRAQTMSWSAIILDTALPDGSGFDLLSALRDMNYQNGILFLTASRNPSDKIRALDEGADDYITRPYEAAEFLSRVRALLRRVHRQHRRTGEVLRVAGIALDINALEVLMPGQRRQRLTPNEMRLLHYLMTHAGDVVSKDELAARLLGAESPETASNVVGVYVRRVRRKIEVNPDQPRLIVTLRGKGYCFQATNEHNEPGLETNRLKMRTAQSL